MQTSVGSYSERNAQFNYLVSESFLKQQLILNLVGGSHAM